MNIRPLTDESGYSCDWGGCDEVAVQERESAVHGWLPVCGRHGMRQRRASPGRATCPACGKSYALSVAGLLPLHNDRWDACAGARKPPAAIPQPERTTSE